MKRRPKLKPMKLTNKTIERMAEITDKDITDANAEWKEYAKIDELLESEPEIEGEGNANGS